MTPVESCEWSLPNMNDVMIVGSYISTLSKISALAKEFLPFQVLHIYLHV